MDWQEYKEKAKSRNPEAKAILEEAEAKAVIISAMIKRRHELGLTQKQLAELCEIPQSSVGRIEAYVTVPRLDTLLKIFSKLGLILEPRQKTAG